MPLTEHFRVSWLFDIINEPEEAVTGLNFRSVDPEVWQPQDAWNQLDEGTLQSLDTAMHTFLTVVGQGFAFAKWGRYLGLKVAWIKLDGSYALDPMIYSRPTPYSGTQIGFPAQSTICISTKAETGIGKATKGRMYIPYVAPVSWDDATAPRISPTYVSNISIYAGNFIRDVNAAFNGVTPKPVAVIMGETAFNKIHTVAVGDVVDTQRRRRNRMTEVYSSHVVP